MCGVSSLVELWWGGCPSEVQSLWLLCYASKLGLPSTPTRCDVNNQTPWPTVDRRAAAQTTPPSNTAASAPPSRVLSCALVPRRSARTTPMAWTWRTAWWRTTSAPSPSPSPTARGPAGAGAGLRGQKLARVPAGVRVCSEACMLEDARGSRSRGLGCWPLFGAINPALSVARDQTFSRVSPQACPHHCPPERINESARSRFRSLRTRSLPLRPPK
jgi:hypothetical protein